MTQLILKPFYWILSLLFTVLLLVFLLIALAGFYVPYAAEKYVTHQTGFALDIKDSYLNLFLGEIDTWDVSIKNPNRFHEPFLIEAKQISAHVNPFSLMTPQLHIKQLVIDIDEISWVKTADREVNLDSFLNAFKAKPTQQPIQKAAIWSESSNLTNRLLQFDHYYIDTLIIHIGTINRIDYSGGVAKASRYQIDLKLELHAVDSLADVMPALSMALMKMGVAFFAETLLKDIPLNLSESVLQKGSHFMEKTPDILNKGAELIKEQTQKIKSLF